MSVPRSSAPRSAGRPAGRDDAHPKIDAQERNARSRLHQSVFDCLDGVAKASRELAPHDFELPTPASIILDSALPPEAARLPQWDFTYRGDGEPFDALGKFWGPRDSAALRDSRRRGPPVRRSAARRLGISERTLRDVLKKHGVGLVRFGGGRPRVRERDVERLIQPATDESAE